MGTPWLVRSPEYPAQSPGPGPGRLPGWVSGDLSDPRQQLLEGIKFDLNAPAGIPLMSPSKAAGRGSGVVFGKISPSYISPSATQHDMMRTELSGSALVAGWGHMHLADMPLGTANFVFVEDGTGNPALALLVNANVAAGAAIAYSKLALANSIVTGDIVNGTILDADINAAAAIALTKLATDMTPSVAANQLGSSVGQCIQFDLTTLATANTAYAGGALGADMNTHAATLQVRLVTMLRITNYGACTGASCSPTFNRISSGAASAAATMRTNSHNMTPAANPVPNGQIIDSGWVNAGSELAQAWNLNTDFNFLTARPTAGQLYIQGFMRAV